MFCCSISKLIPNHSSVTVSFDFQNVYVSVWFVNQGDNFSQEFNIPVCASCAV